MSFPNKRMDMKLLKLLVVFLSAAILASCTSDEKMKEQITKILKDDPKVLTEAIEKHPDRKSVV